MGIELVCVFKKLPTCRAHAFWLGRACRTARLDTLDTTSSTRSSGSTRNLVGCVICIKLWYASYSLIYWSIHSFNLFHLTEQRGFVYVRALLLVRRPPCWNRIAWHARHARLDSLDTSNVSSGVETWRDELSGMWAYVSSKFRCVLNRRWILARWVAALSLGLFTEAGSWAICRGRVAARFGRFGAESKQNLRRSRTKPTVIYQTVR